MKRLSFFLLFIAVTAASFGALPPLPQSKRELLAILSDNRLMERLSTADVIEKITRVDNGYLITTSRETLLVEVTYIHNDRIGPIEFQLDFHQPQSN